tara:strand:- start:1026 stop:1133 length:108 start_codon:yes stop_codon:yes gene_type:complete
MKKDFLDYDWEQFLKEISLLQKGKFGKDRRLNGRQ